MTDILQLLLPDGSTLHMPSKDTFGHDFDTVKVVLENCGFDSTTDLNEHRGVQMDFLRTILGWIFWNWTFYSPSDQDLLQTLDKNTPVPAEQLEENFYSAIDTQAGMLVDKALKILPSFHKFAPKPTNQTKGPKTKVRATGVLERPPIWKAFHKVLLICLNLKYKLPEQNLHYELYYPTEPTGLEAHLVNPVPEYSEGKICAIYAPAIFICRSSQESAIYIRSPCGKGGKKGTVVHLAAVLFIEDSDGP